MFRLSLLLIALAGFGTLVAMPDPGPRAVAPIDDRAARVYGGGPQPQMARAGSASTGAGNPDASARDTLVPEDDAEGSLSITTPDGEVIPVAMEIPPARFGRDLVRIEAEDRNAEARRLAEANARARTAIAERSAALTTTAETATAADMVYATGAYINLRSGPSTRYPAVGFMNYGMAAERLEVLPDGWTRIRILESGLEGFMFSAYLSERAP